MEPKMVRRPNIHKDADAQMPYSMSGLVAGTLILTADGEIPIEFLTPGERVISRARGMVQLKAIEAHIETLSVVRVGQGALGHGVPRHATLMPADQRVLLRGDRARQVTQSAQAVVPVGTLIDGHSIQDLGKRELRLVRLVFDQREVVYADGIEVAINTPIERLQKAA